MIDFGMIIKRQLKLNYQKILINKTNNLRIWDFGFKYL